MQPATKQGLSAMNKLTIVLVTGPKRSTNMQEVRQKTVAGDRILLGDLPPGN